MLNEQKQYQGYQVACDQIRQENEEILKKFEAWLRNQNLKEEKISQNINHIDFYINEYLFQEEEPMKPKDGIYIVDRFLGYWFIKKITGATASELKSYAESFTNFYGFLYELGSVDQKGLDELKDTIEENMEEWLSTLKVYENNSITDVEEAWDIQ